MERRAWLGCTHALMQLGSPVDSRRMRVVAIKKRLDAQNDLTWLSDWLKASWEICGWGSPIGPVPG